MPKNKGFGHLAGGIGVLYQLSVVTNTRAISHEKAHDALPNWGKHASRTVFVAEKVFNDEDFDHSIRTGRLETSTSEKYGQNLRVS